MITDYKKMFSVKGDENRFALAMDGDRLVILAVRGTELSRNRIAVFDHIRSAINWAEGLVADENVTFVNATRQFAASSEDITIVSCDLIPQIMKLPTMLLKTKMATLRPINTAGKMELLCVDNTQGKAWNEAFDSTFRAEAWFKVANRSDAEMYWKDQAQGRYSLLFVKGENSSIATVYAPRETGQFTCTFHIGGRAYFQHPIPGDSMAEAKEALMSLLITEYRSAYTTMLETAKRYKSIYDILCPF